MTTGLSWYSMRWLPLTYLIAREIGGCPVLLAGFGALGGGFSDSPRLGHTSVTPVNFTMS